MYLLPGAIGYYCGACFDLLVDTEEDSWTEDEDEEEDNDGSIEREYSDSIHAKHVSKQPGEYILSPRLFSAEIECYFPDMQTLRTAIREIPNTIGVSGDGSLGGNGIELQTPKLGGKAGEKTITDTCAVLNARRFRVDNRAGLHLHLDGAGLVPDTKTTQDPHALKRLWAFYLNFEDVLLSFLPNSRRSNRYCTLVKNEFHTKEILDCESLEELEKLWYRTNRKSEIRVRKGDKYDNSRYMGVNLHSLLANGHLEIRYHSGTINAIKILEWVNLHQTIMDLAVKGERMSISYLTRAQSMPSLADRTELFFDILGLPDRSREYFAERQATFMDTRKNTDEGSVKMGLPVISIPTISVQ